VSNRGEDSIEHNPKASFGQAGSGCFAGTGFSSFESEIWIVASLSKVLRQLPVQLLSVAS
jgi:hypothetical protein